VENKALWTEGFVGKWKGRDNLEDLGADGTAILKCVKEIESDSRYVKVVGSCAYGNEHADCIKCWEFLELLRNC
jgi:hypothetical protein